MPIRNEVEPPPSDAPLLYNEYRPSVKGLPAPEELSLVRGRLPQRRVDCLVEKPGNPGPTSPGLVIGQKFLADESTSKGFRNVIAPGLHPQTTGVRRRDRAARIRA
jgi:hypothetical protein